MAELDNAYPTQLYDGALAELARLDQTWRTEAAAVKVQYAAAIGRRDAAQADVERLKEASSERSLQTTKLREELATTALNLIVNTPGIEPNPTDVIKLGVQLETGYWIPDRESKRLVRDVEKLDRAVGAGDPILHFVNGSLEYALRPHDTAKHISVVPHGETFDPYKIAFDIPYDTLAIRKLSYERNRTHHGTPKGGLAVKHDATHNIRHDLLSVERRKKYGENDYDLVEYKKADFIYGRYKEYTPEDEDNVYLIGDEAINRTLRKYTSDYPRTRYNNTSELHQMAFSIWQSASLVTEGLEDYDSYFVDDAIELASLLIARSVREGGRLSLPESARPAIRLIQTQNVEDRLRAFTIGLIANQSSADSVLRNSRVLSAVYEEMVDGAI